MVHSNLTQIDTANERLAQVDGILYLLSENKMLAEAGCESIMCGLWGARALLEQAIAAVNALEWRQPL